MLLPRDNNFGASIINFGTHYNNTIVMCKLEQCEVIYMYVQALSIFVIKTSHAFCFRTLTDIEEEIKKEPEVPKTEDGDSKE